MENLMTNPSTKPDLASTNRVNMASSRQFTNRLNTLCTSEDNYMTEPNADQNEFITVDAVTPNPKTQNPQMNNMMGHHRSTEHIE